MVQVIGFIPEPRLATGVEIHGSFPVPRSSSFTPAMYSRGFFLVAENMKILHTFHSEDWKSSISDILQELVLQKSRGGDWIIEFSAGNSGITG